MLYKIDNILQNKCKIQPVDVLLVGVSGGPDSLCLLHVLHQIGYPVIAMHVNHRLRPEAEQEAQVVKQFSNNLGVDFIASSAEVMTYVHENSISIEEAARTLRYRLLFEQAKSCGTKAVVVGHNADDQVESILMHLIRGSGLSGLRGMEYRTIPNPWSDDIPLIRPFLSTWRVDIQKYLEKKELNPVSDSSNMDVSFFRNRLRHELLPVLEGYNPSIREVILRMGQSIKDDYSVLQQLTDNAWETTLIHQGKGYLSFRTAGFLELPLSIQRYVLRRALAYHIPGLYDVGFDCIERGIKMLAEDSPKSQTDLSAGIRLIREGERFWVATWHADLPVGDFPSIPRNKTLILLIPSVLIMDNGWQLEVEETQDVDLACVRNRAELNPFQAWLDISRLELPMIVRSRKTGDEIKPLGMDGRSMKISDLMINLKLPSRARFTWPLVCSGEEIVWVPGYRISHLARIKSNTTHVLHLKLSRVSTT
jgi:tRNA(Ile)-lysidine synthase